MKKKMKNIATEKISEKGEMIDERNNITKSNSSRGGD